MCLAAEGMVVGRGRQTLAFERGDYPIFFFIFLQQKFICHSVGWSVRTEEQSDELVSSLCACMCEANNHPVITNVVSAREPTLLIGAISSR